MSGFSSIWQRKMKSALVEGVLKERFTDHDLRRKTASDLDDLEHAKKLLGHANVGIYSIVSNETSEHYDLSFGQQPLNHSSNTQIGGLKA